MAAMIETEMATNESEGTLEEQANAAYRRGDFKLALELYEKLATLGSKVGCLEAGEILFYGPDGVKANATKAINYLELALTISNARLRTFVACTLYDVYYWGSADVPKDYKKAVHYVKNYELAEQPTLTEARCMYRLAVCYENGFGIEKNVKKALELYRLASATGHVASKINLWKRRFLQGNLLAYFPWFVAANRFRYLAIVSRLKRRDDFRIR